MAGLGIAIAWVGYSVLYYGISQIQGGNFGFLDLILPSRWPTASGTPYDNGSTLASAASPASPATTAAKTTPTAGATATGPLTVNPNTTTARTPGFPVGAQ